MRFAKHAFAALTIIAAAAPVARAEVIWRGDMETGDLSQWSKQQIVSEDRLQAVTDVVREGQYAMRAEVLQGDDPIGASGNRNEVLFTDDQVEGQERVYAWSTLWPEDYASEETWQLFTQWHHTGSDGSPPVEFFVRGETVYLRVSGEDLWTTPLVRGQWHDFVLRVRWAEDGWVELNYDGEQVLGKTSASTLYPGQGVYMKQGLYRDAKIASPQTVFHDGMIVATSLEDIGMEQSALNDHAPAADEGLPSGSLQFHDGTVATAGPSGGCSAAGTAGLLALVPLALGALRRRRR